MEFGLQFFPDVGPAERSAAADWHDALHLTGLADDLGYTTVRTLEHSRVVVASCWRCTCSATRTPARRHVGSPVQILEQIRAYAAEVGGFEHASLQVNFNTIGRAEAEASRRLFAREVMPRFR